MLGCSLKGNPYLERAVMTGILSVAKEGMFSGLNNIQVYTVLDKPYSTHFGFTESEVATLLQEYGLNEKSQEIKRWYNGYRFGETTLYNPWSINNCINNEGMIQPYWVNTSQDGVISKILMMGNDKVQDDLDALMNEGRIKRVIDTNITFENLTNGEHLWGMLLMAGYLKVTEQNFIERKMIYTMKSNRESDRGRYDYVIISHVKDRSSILMEFKRVKPKDYTPQKLIETAEDALLQIDQKQYFTDILAETTGQVIKVGFAFSGKNFCLKSQSP